MLDWIYLAIRAGFAGFLVISTYFGIRKAGGTGNVYATLMVVLLVGTSITMFLIYDHGKYWFKLIDR